MMKVNIGSIIQKKSSDYLPIGMFETYEEASEFIKKIRQKIQGEERRETENAYLNPYQTD